MIISLPETQTTLNRREVKRLLKMREAREKRGMTASELARRVGIAPSYVVSLETGARRNPSLSVMKRIAAELETPMSEMFFEEVT